ncbi:P2R1A-PPP2R2A-interacting phosphatase regulator 1 isoform X1 [Achroia grisella]|uniref:P2R1A-PPP2R2A-interacting phosphatase regulator 1 isoform X1 n=1 Tax=Achroia grisella TaxID=688607 RepID=UPI0027D234C8|nr:P2R1A-PPP2R2A-interacting phosphatase regulator 1 isoform X1 [Achroia grisella]
MDVDAPNILKRCSSAPLINEAASTAAISPTTNTAPRNTFFNMFSNNNVSRTRRHSGSFSPLACQPVTNSWGPRLTPRVNQLRAEECADVSNTREVAHEREVHSAMQMGQSCEDLTLVTGISNSPTRLQRFSPVVSPSPTRKYTTRRSLSPIAIRASSFSPVSSRPNMFVAKRRCDETDSPLSKRMCTSDRLTPSTPGTPDSDSLECTFRPVSPRAQPMNESPNESQDRQDNHKSPNPS